MMTQPDQQELERRYLEASAQPRGGWGDVAFVLVDDDEADEDEEE